MNRFYQLIKQHSGIVKLALAAIILLASGSQVLAHHPFGGTTPTSPVEGFLSGLGHPVIGLDHLAFVVASGLIGMGLAQRIMVPVAFVAATIIGTGIHLAAVTLPLSEVIIAASVVGFGALIAMYRLNPTDQPVKLEVFEHTYILTAIAAVSGIFHGYAYGEAIIGAEMSSTVAYLAGFAGVQLAIALTAFWLSRYVKRNLSLTRGLGLAIAAVGMVFLSKSFG